ncbi:hypothetical protein CH368_08495 [Leptospira levettii]|nr:hypothetical protein CH368_08495 [Leptospira levettii]
MLAFNLLTEFLVHKMLTRIGVIMRHQFDNRLRFSMNEFNQEFVLKDWRQFSNDIQNGNLHNIDEILCDYFSGKIGIDDILSTFPPSEIAHLVPGKNDNLIRIYKRLKEEFNVYRQATYVQE